MSFYEYAISGKTDLTYLPYGINSIQTSCLFEVVVLGKQLFPQDLAVLLYVQDKTPNRMTATTVGLFISFGEKVVSLKCLAVRPGFSGVPLPLIPGPRCGRFPTSYPWLFCRRPTHPPEIPSLLCGQFLHPVCPVPRGRSSWNLPCKVCKREYLQDPHWQ